MQKLYFIVVLLTLPFLHYTELQATALHKAARNNDVEEINRLLMPYEYNNNFAFELGAAFQSETFSPIHSIDELDEDGATTLHSAIEKGSLGAVEFLLEHGATLQDNQTLLDVALNHKQAQVVKFLFNRGEKTTSEQLSHAVQCLEGYMAQLGNNDIGKWADYYLTLHMINEELKNVEKNDIVPDNNKTIEASPDSNGTIIKKDIPITQKAHSLTLHEAIKKGLLDEVKLLLKNEGDPNIPDKQGNYPLLLAIEQENFKMVKALVYSGANISNIKIQIDGILKSLFEKYTNSVAFAGILQPCIGFPKETKIKNLQNISIYLGVIHNLIIMQHNLLILKKNLEDLFKYHKDQDNQKRLQYCFAYLLHTAHTPGLLIFFGEAGRQQKYKELVAHTPLSYEMWVADTVLKLGKQSTIKKYIDQKWGFRASAVLKMLETMGKQYPEHIANMLVWSETYDLNHKTIQVKEPILTASIRTKKENIALRLLNSGAYLLKKPQIVQINGRTNDGITLRVGKSFIDGTVTYEENYYVQTPLALAIRKFRYNSPVTQAILCKIKHKHKKPWQNNCS